MNGYVQTNHYIKLSKIISIVLRKIKFIIPRIHIDNHLVQLTDTFDLLEFLLVTVSFLIYKASSILSKISISIYI